MSVTRKRPLPAARIEHPYIDDLSFLDYTDTELVIGLVYAVGTDFNPIADALEASLRRFQYKCDRIRLSGFLSQFGYSLQDRPEHRRIESRMDAGNRLRRNTKSPDILALRAVADILEKRDWAERPSPKTREAHILLSLKRPEEVSLLRKIYGPGFFLIGVYASEQERLDHLLRNNSPREEALRLMERDELEEDPFGQQTRDTFALADVFIQGGTNRYKKQLQRFFDLVFSHPYTTPEPDEYAMFLAYASSLRSGSLARQVGASILSNQGEIIAVGCNDVPRAGGGLYWPGADDNRDHVLKQDSNDQHLQFIRERVDKNLRGLLRSRGITKRMDILKGALEITEFGRATHAEMEALLACARSGISPRKGSLYTTTFPCHNCTRHIITAGISRVVFIEPYPKSRAETLHRDAIEVTGNLSKPQPRGVIRIPFEPFVGVGPRRFFDLFSTRLSSGYRLTRKINGETVEWNRSSAIPRVPMQPTSYLTRELRTFRELGRVLKQTRSRDHGHKEKTRRRTS